MGSHGKGESGCVCVLPAAFKAESGDSQVDKGKKGVADGGA